MKRERTHRTLHHFSFGERFDETMMNIYHLVISLLSYQLINSSDFYPPTSLRDKRMEENATIRKLVGRTSDLPAVRPTDKEKRIISTTRKGLPIPLVLSQVFENRKAIELIRAFSLRSAGTAKNAQMSQRGYTPLDTPVCHAA